MKVALFDLDGTLADNSHRQHLVRDGNKDWDGFFAAQSIDKVNDAVAMLFRALIKSGEFRVFVITARPSRYQLATEAWLAENSLYPERLLMRRDGDRREDSIVKRELFEMDEFAVDP